MAATTMTKTQLVAFMAEKIEITKKQAALFFETLAELETTAKFYVAKVVKDAIAPVKAPAKK